jgi:hypothetical protein
MSSWQFILLLSFFIINAGLLYAGWRQVVHRNNPYGLTRPLSVLGMFVWGDVVVLAVFWMVAALASLLFQDWLLFWFTASLFWVVRSLGETIYWFLQQFASVKRDLPESLPAYRFIKSDAIWFMFQLLWQCILVLSLVASVFIGRLWLEQL